MARGLELFSDNGRTEAVCFSLGGLDDPDYEELCALARGLAAGAKPLTDRGEPLVVAVEKDMAKALGQRLAAEIPAGNIVRGRHPRRSGKLHGRDGTGIWRDGTAGSHQDPGV